MQLPGQKALRQLLEKCKEYIWIALLLTTKQTKREGHWPADVHKVKGKYTARPHTQSDLRMEDAQTMINWKLQSKKWNAQAFQCFVLKKKQKT